MQVSPKFPDYRSLKKVSFDAHAQKIAGIEGVENTWRPKQMGAWVETQGY